MRDARENFIVWQNAFWSSHPDNNFSNTHTHLRAHHPLYRWNKLMYILLDWHKYSGTEMTGCNQRQYHWMHIRIWSVFDSTNFVLKRQPFNVTILLSRWKDPIHNNHSPSAVKSPYSKRQTTMKLETFDAIFFSRLRHFP